MAAAVIPACIVQRHLGAILLETAADASARAGDAELADALRRTAAESPPPQAELARVAAVLLELRALGPKTHAAAVRIVEDVLDLARAQRRR